MVEQAEWDVAVVGGGPAGLSAAHAAAAAGARTVIVERAEHPRYKTCGGGLIGASLNAVRDLPRLPGRDEIRSTTFTLRGGREFTRSDARPLLTTVMRAEFDAALLDRALAAGAQIRQRTMVRAITEEDGCAAVRLGDGSTVTASVVIGADGSSGVTARHVGVRFDQVDLGLELEIAIPPAVQREWAGRILLDWGKIPASYGWVFPKGDRLTVGVIAARNAGSRFAQGAGKQGEATREYLREFVGRLGLAGFEVVQDSGHLTRCRSDDSPLRAGRVIVAGDAAGLLEPWTREGISFALRSGALAGEIAAKASTLQPHSQDALDEYTAAINRGLGEEMRASRVLLTAFTRHTGTFHKGLATAKGWRGFLALCRSELPYPELIRKPAARAALSVLNRLLLCGHCMANGVDGEWCVRFPGVSMGGKWMSLALDWDLSAADVLRLVRRDAHPVALFGAWAGGSDIIASVPVITSRQLSIFDGEFQEKPGRFGGGWIGYLGYGAAAGYLPVPPAPGGPRHLPLAWWGYYDHVLRRDRATGQWYFEALFPVASNSAAGPSAASAARGQALEARLAELRRRAAAGPPPPAPYEVGSFELTPSAAEHQESVRRTVEYVVQGDIFQANICLRLEAAFHGDPLEAFCAAATRLDPPYAAFLRLPGGAAVASLSPELFLRRTGNRVQSSPIKGTWPRPEDPLAAELSRKELEASAKDGAENVMIVDLMRNDLSRVCLPGSVQVPALLRAEPHPGIWHLVSDVVGTLPAQADDESLIAATFPPGSVTGAPKVRALEIIHELEPVPREVYTGSIGYRSPLAGLELNVAIRTFEFQGSRVWLGAGGGITARSVPDSEYQECLVKARPLIQAIDGEIAPAASVPSPVPAVLPEGLRPRAANGVFTSMLVTDGQVADLDEHLARLEASTTELYGKRLPERLLDDLAACLATRPSGRLRLTARPVGGPLQVKVEVVPAAVSSVAVSSAAVSSVAVSSVALHPVVLPGGHGRHKWQDRRELAELVSRAGRDSALGPDDHVLIVDADGDVLETDRGNVFAVIDGTLCTPPLDSRLLPGITRATVLRLAAEAGIAAKEVRFTLDAVADAAEVFVTNAVWGVIPVRPGPVSERLRAALAARPLSAVPAVRGSLPGRASRAGRATAAAQVSTSGLVPSVGRGLTSPLGDRGARPVIVLIDNYDSFTYNLAHLLAAAGCEVEVISNDEVEAAQVAAHRPDGIIISPGPCAPAEAGISVDVIRACGATTPILGICLGHQAIAVAYGGTVVRATSPAHGFASPVSHDGAGALAGLPSDFSAARYHSLVVDEGSLPPELRVTARLADEPGIVMGLRHASHPVEGLQFHPESILTVPHGRTIIGNFLRAVRR